MCICLLVMLILYFHYYFLAFFEPKGKTRTWVISFCPSYFALARRNDMMNVSAKTEFFFKCCDYFIVSDYYSLFTNHKCLKIITPATLFTHPLFLVLSLSHPCLQCQCFQHEPLSEASEVWLSCLLLILHESSEHIYAKPFSLFNCAGWMSL